ncbi:MAG: chromate efflux transporter [Sandaracinaceae bacterium]|nr:chromate efflux transporter [Sandaracinaceae bacterium]
MSANEAAGEPAHGNAEARGSALEVLLAFTKLGLTSFGGPVAHLGYFQAELVDRRKWIDRETYADLVALCQFLPGPSSSQVGISLGIERAGLAGGLAAWLGFTLPSALALALFALGVGTLEGADAWIHGLKVVAVPIVAIAVRDMARALCPDRRRATIAVLGALAALAWASALSQVAIIAGAGVLGWLLYRGEGAEAAVGAEVRAPLSPWIGVAAWIVFFALLFGLPVLASMTSLPGLDLFERFYRVGALVFGGGHVVLPLLEHEVVAPGWTTSDRFLAGYGAAQAVPGPLFSLSAYLGFVLDTTPTRWAGAALALVAIFLPSFLLVVGALPFWARLRRSAISKSALKGTNAAVVGLLAAALYDPVWKVAIETRADFGLALAAFLALSVWKAPPWLVVALTAGASVALRSL